MQIRSLGHAVVKVRTRQEVQTEFLRLREGLGKTAIFVTHDIREALRVGTRIGLLNHGRLETLSRPQEFLRAEGEEARAFLACLDGGGDP